MYLVASLPPAASERVYNLETIAEGGRVSPVCRLPGRARGTESGRQGWLGLRQPSELLGRLPSPLWFPPAQTNDNQARELSRKIGSEKSLLPAGSASSDKSVHLSEPQHSGEVAAGGLAGHPGLGGHLATMEGSRG